MKGHEKVNIQFNSAAEFPLINVALISSRMHISFDVHIIYKSHEVGRDDTWMSCAVYAQRAACHTLTTGTEHAAD